MTSVSGPSGCRVKNTRNMHISCAVAHAMCSCCHLLFLCSVARCLSGMLGVVQMIGPRSMPALQKPRPPVGKKQRSAVGDAVVSQTPHKR